MSLAWRIRGDLDAVALQEAFSALVAQDASLHATLVQKSGIWVVTPKLADLEWSVEDLRASRPSYRETRLHERLRDARERPFTYGGSLVRARLYRVSDHEHVLLWVAHDCVWSRWRADALLRTLSTLYLLALAREPLPRPASAAIETQLVANTRGVRRGRREAFSLSSVEASAARLLAAREKTSLAHVCCAAFWMLLGRQQTELSICTEIQAHAEEKPIVGRCAGTPGNGSLTELLVALDGSTRSSFDTRPEAFEASFAFEQTRDHHALLGSLSCIPIRFRDPLLSGVMAMTVQETRFGLLVNLDYASEVFGTEAVTRLIADFRQALGTCL